MLFLHNYQMSKDEIFIKRCLHLAALGSGSVAPNPLVGCVIVHDGKIIGEGYHMKFGAAHAEVNAIHSVQDTSLLPKAKLFVNLEPCSHFGKTPPCADFIIASGIKEVSIGMKDPNKLVSGNGIAKLGNAGVKVKTGILEEECTALNKRFICAHTNKRPYITLKWAQSSDGIIGSESEKIQISNEISLIIGHKWRSEESAILIGARTALIDDPELSTRYWDGPSPVRIISDRSGSLSKHDNLKVFSGRQRTIVFTQIENKQYKNALTQHIHPNAPFIPALLNQLHQSGIHSVLVEGGSYTIREFIDHDLWDECRVFVSPHTMNKGIFAPHLPYGKIIKTELAENQLLEINNYKKP